jgi:nucleotide-binding universal stress UspA family protein
MATRILVPVDGSERSREACDFAVREHPEAEFVLLHVINPTEAGYSASASFPAASEEWYEHAKEDAAELLEELETENEGTAVTTDSVVGKPARAIVEYAAEHDVDRIVMGSHGRSGVTRILLGSVAENVVRNATVPVTVAR